MQVQRDILGVRPNRYLRAAHIHAVLVGFVMFLIFGGGATHPEKGGIRDQ
jgi:hypothetical protein